MSDPQFLPGVPVAHVLDRLARAGGKEIETGKFASPDSSAALAVNTFGWFAHRPADLPPFPGLPGQGAPHRVDIEYCARFPWSGGRHPWLDAVVETATHLIGVESKRFEPYRDAKKVVLSPAYDRPVWGDGMAPFEQVRDTLRSGGLAFAHLDGAQLVKHAFGLVTDGRRRDKVPVLLYLFAEPAWLGGKPISAAVLARHRAEIAQFAELVRDATVRFHALSYRDWLAGWPELGPIGDHARAITAAFAP
ncbi:PGN_0703 family putative restriction endonuclease [Zavarzinia sp. CC-PAN008]|uniref:PGN_0703 family putative restriction endonuclease n=1 Tax=Zavarzinia sp. CC-PAN008 TaxID=3243332 RepID=UPI003F744894